MRKYLLLPATLLVGILFAWYIGTVFAHPDGVYLAQESSAHFQGITPYVPSTYANKSWVLGADNDPIRYYSEDPGLLNLAQKAVLKWTDEFLDLKWLRAASTSTAELTFVYDTCGGDPASINLTQPHNAMWYTDEVRRARYWVTAAHNPEAFLLIWRICQ